MLKHRHIIPFIHNFLNLQNALIYSIWIFACLVFNTYIVCLANAQTTTQIGDLSVAITALPNEVMTGGIITYRIDVSNSGQIFCSTPSGPCRMNEPPMSNVDLLFDMTDLGGVQSFGGNSNFECYNTSEPRNYVWCINGFVPAGSTATVSVTAIAPLSGGTYTGSVFVDVFQRLLEKSKTNNKAAVTINVSR
jgi:hypothetical protein